MTLALPEEVLAEIEAIVADQRENHPQTRAEIVRDLIAEGLSTHRARKHNLAG